MWLLIELFNSHSLTHIPCFHVKLVYNCLRWPDFDNCWINYLDDQNLFEAQGIVLFVCFSPYLEGIKNL